MTEIPEHLRRRAEAARGNATTATRPLPPLPGLPTEVAKAVADEFASHLTDDGDDEDCRMVALTMALAFAAGRSKSATEVVGDAEEFHAYLFPASPAESTEAQQ